MTTPTAVTEAVRCAWFMFTDAPFPGARMLRERNMGHMPQIDFQRPLPFGGVTFDAEKDGKRLTTYLQKTREIMSDGRWRTLRELSAEVGCSETSVSARIRDLRKKWGGGHTVDKKRLEGGLWIYRMVN